MNQVDGITKAMGLLILILGRSLEMQLTSRILEEAVAMTLSLETLMLTSLLALEVMTL